MKTEKIQYECEGVACHGFLAAPDSAAKSPAILIAHAWKGLDDFAKEQAQKMADWGYTVLCADVYGDGKQAETNEEAFGLMAPLFEDRKTLRKRIVSAFHTLAGDKRADPSKIAAIGFCFGGATVIELLKSGVDVTGVVSCHGVLGYEVGGVEAKTEPAEGPVKGALLALHGNDDPMVSQADLNLLKQEMTEARIDWQLHIFGGAMHAFTNPDANDPDNGLVFDPKADKRSWKMIRSFFEEKFA